MKMKIIVTGGSGFIGTNFITFIESKGFEILNIDIKEPKNKDQFKYWEKVDICDYNSFFNSVNRFNPNYIVHLAARTDLDEKKNIEGYSVNTIGVSNLMKICSELKELKRTIIASSMLVCKLGYFPVDGNDYCPNTIYGESKVITEKIVKEYENLDWILVRPTSIWGPWFGAPYNNFFRLVRSSKYVNLNNKRAAIKTYGFVTNTCDQIFSLMTSLDKSIIHDYFYLGDAPPINISDWANIICDCENKKRPYVIPSLILKLVGWGGDILQRIGIRFPMSSFRYKNMTTNHIIDLSKTLKIAEHKEGNDSNDNLYLNTKETINWLNKIK
jgi:nucleoside-diphosphate-sugar epimerase